MKYYEIAVPFVQLSGRLHLTDAQAQSRAHALAPVKGADNVFATKSPVGFKQGELVGYEGDLPKAMAGALKLRSMDFEAMIKKERAAATAGKRQRQEDRARREADAKKRQADKAAQQAASQGQARKDAERRHSARA